jgi:hypothetical protein
LLLVVEQVALVKLAAVEQVAFSMLHLNQLVLFDQSLLEAVEQEAPTKAL